MSAVDRAAETLSAAWDALATAAWPLELATSSESASFRVTRDGGGAEQRTTSASWSGAGPVAATQPSCGGAAGASTAPPAEAAPPHDAPMATVTTSTTTCAAKPRAPPTDAAAREHQERMMRLSRKVARSFDVTDDEFREHLAAYVYRLVKYAEIQETEDRPTPRWESGVWFLAGALVLIDDLTRVVPMEEVMRHFTPHTLMWSAMLVAIKTLTDTRLSLPYMALVGGFSTEVAGRFEVLFLDMIKFAVLIHPERHARILRLLTATYDSALVTAAAAATSTTDSPTKPTSSSTSHAAGASGGRARRRLGDGSDASSAASSPAGAQPDAERLRRNLGSSSSLVSARSSSSDASSAAW